MSLLIKNGFMMTMTEQGSLVGDILIEGGRIVQVGTNIQPAAVGQSMTIDAAGLTILPGMIDLSIHECGFDRAYLSESAIIAGITTSLLMPDDQERCMIMSAHAIFESAVTVVYASCMTDDQLSIRLNDCLSNEDRILCPIYSEHDCRRILSAVGEDGKRIILTGLAGCDELAEEIARSGCSVVLGVQRAGNNPWALAAHLDRLGVCTAISCFHPATKMKLLPVCVGLCMREGMPHAQALRAITSNGADILGLDDRGRIAPGTRADLVIFDGDPLLLASSRVMTIAEGKISRK